MSRLIKIGLPSKGRLKDESLKIFKKNNLLIKDSKRNYLSEIKNFSLNLYFTFFDKIVVEKIKLIFTRPYSFKVVTLIK